MSLAIIVQSDGVIRELNGLPDGVEVVMGFTQTADPTMAMIQVDPLSTNTQLIGSSGKDPLEYHLVDEPMLSPLRVYTTMGELDNNLLYTLLRWYRSRASTLISALRVQEVATLEELTQYSHYFGLPTPTESDPTPDPGDLDDPEETPGGLDDSEEVEDTDELLE